MFSCPNIPLSTWKGQLVLQTNTVRKNTSTRKLVIFKEIIQYKDANYSNGVVDTPCNFKSVKFKRDDTPSFAYIYYIIAPTNFLLANISHYTELTCLPHLSSYTLDILTENLAQY